MRQMPMRRIHTFAPAFPYANEHRTKLPRPNGPYIAHRKLPLRDKRVLLVRSNSMSPRRKPQPVCDKRAPFVRSNFMSPQSAPPEVSPSGETSVCDKRVLLVRSDSMSPRRKPQPRKFRRKAKLRCVTNEYPSFDLTLCHTQYSTQSPQMQTISFLTVTKI